MAVCRQIRATIQHGVSIYFSSYAHTPRLMEKTPVRAGISVYDTYGEALNAAKQITSHRDNTIDRSVTKVIRSPYGNGYIVRTFPATYFRNARLRADIRMKAREACYGDV